MTPEAHDLIDQTKTELINQFPTAPEHQNPTDCQLLLAVTGNKEYIVETLKQLLNECSSEYGKPCQATISQFGGISEVRTPVWDGEEY